MSSEIYRVDKDYMNKLREKTGVEKGSTLVSEALNFLDWAVTQVKKGRVLLCTDENLEHKERVIIPILEKVNKELPQVGTTREQSNTNEKMPPSSDANDNPTEELPTH